MYAFIMHHHSGAIVPQETNRDSICCSKSNSQQNHCHVLQLSCSATLRSQDLMTDVHTFVPGVQQVQSINNQ